MKPTNVVRLASSVERRSRRVYHGRGRGGDGRGRGCARRRLLDACDGRAGDVVFDRGVGDDLDGAEDGVDPFLLDRERGSVVGRGDVSPDVFGVALEDIHK